MIRAFVGHSFEPEDELVVMAFTKIFNSLKKSFDFDWEDADDTQIKPLSKKVPQKMVDKNLFIGIFTKKHIELEEKRLLKTRPWNRDKYISRKTDWVYGTSYWITQESGYAIAQGMATLFLIEKGVRELKGLHADMERIYFERGKESECFIKLNEALGQFLSESKGEDGKGRSDIPPKEPSKEINIVVSEDINVEEQIKTEKDKKKEIKGHKEEKNDEYYFREIYFALHRKEEAKFEELKKEIFEKYKADDNNTIEWQAKILALESFLIQKDVFNDLIDLQKKKPDNPLIAFYVGEEYEKYKNYEKAIEEYLKSAKHETRMGSKLHKINLAAHAYVKNNQGDKAVDILLKDRK